MLRSSRPHWVGLRWGAAAGAVCAGLLGALVALVILTDGISAAALPVESLVELALPFLGVGAVLLLIGCVFGAVMMFVIHRTLLYAKTKHSHARMVALIVCLVTLVLILVPVFVLLYMDGNFWRGLEELLLFLIPLLFMPGSIMTICMVMATGRNVHRWFPERT